MKKTIILLAYVFLLAACEENSAGGTVNDTQVQLDAQKLDFLQKENEALKNLLSEPPSQPQTKEAVTPDTELEDFRETLNLTLQIIGAMETRDYDYLESVSSSSVTFDRTTDTFKASDHENRLLDSVTFRNLQYRFFNKSADNSAEIGVAKVDEGAVEIYFQFTRENDIWLFDGMITN